MAELVEEEVTIEPSADWTIEQWDEWANNLPEGKIKADYFDKKSKGKSFEYSSMTSGPITVEFKPIAKTEVQLGAENLELGGKSVDLYGNIENVEKKAEFEAELKIIEDDTRLTDTERSKKKGVLISKYTRQNEIRQIITDNTPLIKENLYKIENIVSDVYNPKTKSELRKEAITEVETTTVTGGGTGFGEMSMGGSNVVTTKSLPYLEFEKEAKEQIQKELIKENQRTLRELGDDATKFDIAQSQRLTNIDDIPEDAWKGLAIDLYIKDAQERKVDDLVSEQMEVLEDEFDNWYYRFSNQYWVDVDNYNITRTTISKILEKKKDKAVAKIEQEETRLNLVGTSLETLVTDLDTKGTELSKFEEDLSISGNTYEKAIADWNDFIKQNPDTNNYNDRQLKKFNELQENLAIYKNNYTISMDIYNSSRGEYNKLLGDAQSSERTYNILNKRINGIIEESKIDTYAQIADITKRSFDNTDVFVNKMAATGLDLGANIMDLQRIGTEKVLDIFGMDAKGAEEVSKLLTGGDATTFLIDKTREISEDLRGSVRKNISTGDIDSLGDLGNFMIDLFAEQIINTAITVSTGSAGLIIVSAGAAGGKLHEMKEEEGKQVWNSETGKYEEIKYDPWQYLLSGTIAFGAEYLTETVSLNQFKSMANVFKKGGKIAPGGSSFNLRGTKYSNTEFTIGGAVYRYAKNVNKEGMAELFAEGFNNMGDRFILGKDISLTQGLSEAYISGSLMSGLGFQLPVVVSEVRKSFASDAEVSSYKKNGLKIKGLTERLDKLMTITGPITQDKLDAIESLNKERDALIAENHKILGTNNQRMDDMDNVDKRRVLDINDKKHEIRSEIDGIQSNNTLTQGEQDNAISQKIIEMELLDAEKLRIISNATLRADAIRENKLENQKLVESGLGEKLINIEGDKEADTKENAIKAIEETEIDDAFLEDYIKGKDITKEQAAEELKKAAISNIEDQFKKMKEGQVSGFQTGTEFGIPMSIAIKDNAALQNPTVKSHERGHHGLFRKLMDGDADAIGLIDDLESYVKKRYKGAYKAFQEAKETYKDQEGYTKLDKYEEKLAFLTDFLRKKNIKSDLSLRGKLLERVKKMRGEKDKGSQLNEIRTGEDMFNLLLSFTSSYEKGEMSGLAAKVMKGEVGVKTKTKDKDKKAPIKDKKPSTRLSKSDFNIQDETSANKAKRQDARNVAVQKIYDKHAKGKTKQEWKEFLQTSEGIGVRNEMLTDYMPDMIAIAKSKGFENPMDSAFEGIDPLIKHIEAFNPEANDNLANYTGAYLGLKVGTGAKKVRSKSDTKSIEELKEKGKEIVDAPVDTKESTKQPKAIKLKDRLGDKAKKIDKEVKKKSKTIDLDKVNFKTLKDLTPKLTQEMFGVTPKPGNLTKADVRNAQQFIVKNWETLLAMLPEGSTPSGTATGVQKVLLDAFYTKGKRTKAAKTGSKAGLQEQTKKDNITKEQFLEVFGITPAGQANIADRNTSSRVKAMISQTGRMLTNQAIREQAIEKGETVPSKVWEGKSKTMFSKAVKEQVQDKSTLTAQEISNQIEDALEFALKYGANSAMWDIMTAPLDPIVIETMEDIGLKEAFNKEATAYKLPMLSWKYPKEFKSIPKVWRKNATNKNNKTAMKQLLDFSKEFKKFIDPRVGKMLGIDFFGFTNRYLDAAEEKRDTKQPAEYYEESLLFKKYFEGESNQELDFNPDDIRIFNSGYGIMGKIENILSKDITKDEKWELLGKNKDGSTKEGSLLEEVEKANIANKAAMKYVYDKASEVLAKRPDLGIGFVRWQESATNNTKAQRGLTSLDLIEVLDGSQAVYYNPKTKTYKNNLSNVKNKEDFIINKKHPNYNEATKFVKEQFEKEKNYKKLIKDKKAFNKALAKALKFKGEHITPSANMMKNLAQITLSNAAAKIQNPNIELDDIDSPLNEIINNFSQSLGTELFSAIQDLKLGTTSVLNNLRALALNKDLRDNFVTLDGKSATEYINKLEIYDKVVQSIGKEKRKTAEINSETITSSKVMYSKSSTNAETIRELGILDKALQIARDPNTPVKKIRVFDFDDTLARTKSSVIYTKPNTTGKPSSDLKAIVMAGGPGSGKSSVIRKLGLQNQGYKVVNQDISLEWAKKLVGLDPKEAKYDAVQRSVRSELGALAIKIADKKLNQYTTEGKGVILDGTGASIKATEAKVKALKDKGYEVSMIYVETSKETALDRNRKRKERSLKDKIVETTWDSVNANKQDYKSKFGESFFEVDANESVKKLPTDVINNIDSKLNETIRGKISPAEFASKGTEMESEGTTWDFSEFKKVVDGKKGPLLEVAKKIQEARGTEDVFVLTARPQEAAGPIKEFLESIGLNIPINNITGLSDSSPLAKSGWIVDKAAEGYNDFYFADDHGANVEAVQDALDALPVKGKTQQAKVKFSMDTKRNLKWKRTRYEAKTKFEIEGKTYTIDLARHVDGKDYTLSFGLEHLDKKGFLKKDHFITGTGNAAEILSIISNGVVDFVKKNKVNSVHFTSLEGSRTRLYTTLTKLWANELDWNHEIEYDPEYKDMKGAASFVISKTKTSFKTRLQPTQKVLDVIDVKGKVQQAKVKFSKSIDQKFKIGRL